MIKYFPTIAAKAANDPVSGCGHDLSVSIAKATKKCHDATRTQTALADCVVVFGTMDITRLEFGD